MIKLVTKLQQVDRNVCKCIKSKKRKYDIYISIQTLYSVLCWNTFGSDYSHEPSWVWLCKLGTPVFGEFNPFISADILKICLQRCSIGFKSGLWQGCSRTFRDLSRSHCCVVLAVCLGSLSCWKVNLHPSRRTWALWSRFSSRITLYFALFIFPSILTSLPVPAA